MATSSTNLSKHVDSLMTLVDLMSHVLIQVMQSQMWHLWCLAIIDSASRFCCFLFLQQSLFDKLWSRLRSFSYSYSFSLVAKEISLFGCFLFLSLGASLGFGDMSCRHLVMSYFLWWQDVVSTVLLLLLSAGVESDDLVVHVVICMLWEENGSCFMSGALNWGFGAGWDPSWRGWQIFWWPKACPIFFWVILKQ